MFHLLPESFFPLCHLTVPKFNVEFQKFTVRFVRQHLDQISCPIACRSVVCCGRTWWLSLDLTASSRTTFYFLAVAIIRSGSSQASRVHLLSDFLSLGLIIKPEITFVYDRVHMICPISTNSNQVKFRLVPQVMKVSVT